MAQQKVGAQFHRVPVRLSQALIFLMKDMNLEYGARYSEVEGKQASIPGRGRRLGISDVGGL